MPGASARAPHRDVRATPETAPAPPTYLGAALAALVAAGLALTAGCTPESQILFGKWQAKAAITGLADPDAQARILPGGVELVLGHYGRDVVGVVRFYTQQFDASDVFGDLKVPRDPGCPCTFIQAGQFNDEARRVTFTLPSDTACPPDGTVPPPSWAQPELVFTLDLIGDDTLAGTIQYQGADAPRQDVVFQRDTSSSGEVTDNDPDKECKAPQ